MGRWRRFYTQKSHVVMKEHPHQSFVILSAGRSPESKDLCTYSLLCTWGLRGFFDSLRSLRMTIQRCGISSPLVGVGSAARPTVILLHSPPKRNAFTICIQFLQILFTPLSEKYGILVTE